MIDRLNGRTSLLIAAAGLLAVLIIGWFGFLSPQRAKSEELGTRITETEAQIEATDAITEGALAQENAKRLGALRTAIPDEAKMSDILRQLDSAARQSRTRIVSFAPQPVVASGGANAIPITLGIQGEYFAVREFLRILRSRADLRDDDSLRAAGRLFEVDSIMFTGGSDTGGAIQASLAMKAFVFNNPAPSADGGAATPPVDPPASAEASG